MQSHPGIDRKGVEPFANQFGIEGAYLVAREFHVEHQHRPPRNVDHDARQRLVHRHVDTGVAGDAGHGAERLLDRLSERDADIFGGVMMVDVKVANRLHGDVNARMPGKQIEHMVEEADAGRDVGHACPVEVHADLDVGLLGLALDGRRAHEKCFPWPKTRLF